MEAFCLFLQWFVWVNCHQESVYPQFKLNGWQCHYTGGYTMWGRSPLYACGMYTTLNGHWMFVPQLFPKESSRFTIRSDVISTYEEISKFLAYSIFQSPGNKCVQYVAFETLWGWCYSFIHSALFHKVSHRMKMYSRISQEVLHWFILYKVYQNVVNSLKNDSKLKSMKYLFKILFYLENLVSCLPPVANSLVSDSQ